MRYIGCKKNLLSDIENLLEEKVKTRQESFCDIFSGTATVGNHFKGRYRIISNDSLYFSYILQKAYIEGDGKVCFSGLTGIADNIFEYLSDDTLSQKENGFVTENYSPFGTAGRMYFTVENAQRIDFVRTTIEQWHLDNKITIDEYYYLLASLIEAVPSVSNITGTYGAYLKSWDKRAFNKLFLSPLSIIDNGLENKVFNEDALKLITHVSGDILYIDPPYNARQYAPNYHVLETIARYDRPELKGISGMRQYETQKSLFSSKKDVNEAFATLIEKADFNHIIVSYSSSGLMTEEFIEKTLKSNGHKSSYGVKKIPYRKYKSKVYDNSGVNEYLFFISKRLSNQMYTMPYLKSEKNEDLRVAEVSENYSAYIKSPLNYIGGKYKLLPQLIPLFPQMTGTFVDMFCGGCNVGINIECNKVIFNDINTILTGILKTFKGKELDDLLDEIDEIIRLWKLNMENSDGYNALRSHYNQFRDPIELFTLSCFSFNYQLRFNNRHEYNNPFGKNRSHYSESTKKNLIRFVDRLKAIDSEFTNYDFVNFPVETLRKEDFIYCDPPYSITTGTYNDGKRGFKGWTEQSDMELCEFLDTLDASGIRFAMSNVFYHKGKTNAFLKHWSEKYNVIHLYKDYSNSSYNTKRMESDEVIVFNYNKPS